MPIKEHKNLCTNSRYRSKEASKESQKAAQKNLHPNNFV